MYNIDTIIDKVYKPSQINLKSFEQKKRLNPKIWINNKMNPKVRTQLLQIAKEFIKFTDIKFIPVDIIMVGSLASYNWSKYSDVDLHIFCDFNTINNDTTLVKNYFDAKKNEWNNTHNDIKIYGYDVELYVQDINEENASNGIYSIKNNYWIKLPTHQEMSLKKDDIKQLALSYISKIDYYTHKFDELTDDAQFLLLKSKCDYLYNTIRNRRKTSLAEDGEQATGNIVFKVLRRTGHLGLLRDLRNKIFDRINSIDETAFAILPEQLLTESYINEMARTSINKTIDKKLWATVSSTLSRNRDNKGILTRPGRSSKEELLQKYVAALLIMKDPMPQTESDIDKIKTFKLIGHAYLNMGGTLDDIKNLYMQNTASDKSANLSVTKSKKLIMNQYNVHIDFQVYRMTRGTETVKTVDDTIEANSIENAVALAYKQFIIDKGCFKFLRQYRGSEPEYTGPGEWAKLTVTDETTGQVLKVEDIRGGTIDWIYEEISNPKFNWLKPTGNIQYKIKANDAYKESKGFKAKPVKPITYDTWIVKYISKSDGDCAGVWYEAENKLDAISQFRSEYPNHEIITVYKSNN